MGKEIAMKHAIFIGGPMCGFVDDQPVNPKHTHLLGCTRHDDRPHLPCGQTEAQEEEQDPIALCVPVLKTWRTRSMTNSRAKEVEQNGS